MDQSLEHDILPSTISLVDLMQAYDDLVQKSNKQAAATQRLHERIRLVCSLLLKTNSLSERQSTVLETTARRSFLLQRLEQPDLPEEDASAALVPVTIQSRGGGLWEWEHDDAENATLIEIDHSALAGEEDLLLQMANTPIPPVKAADPTAPQRDLQTGSGSSGSNWAQRLRNEWNSDG